MMFLLKHDELNSMIMRRFAQPGDVERARELVAEVSYCCFAGMTYLLIEQI